MIKGRVRFKHQNESFADLQTEFPAGSPTKLDTEIQYNGAMYAARYKRSSTGAIVKHTQIAQTNQQGMQSIIELVDDDVRDLVFVNKLPIEAFMNMSKRNPLLNNQKRSTNIPESKEAKLGYSKTSMSHNRLDELRETIKPSNRIDLLESGRVAAGLADFLDIVNNENNKNPGRTAMSEGNANLLLASVLGNANEILASTIAGGHYREFTAHTYTYKVLSMFVAWISQTNPQNFQNLVAQYLQWGQQAGIFVEEPQTPKMNSSDDFNKAYDCFRYEEEYEDYVRDAKTQVMTSNHAVILDNFSSNNIGSSTTSKVRAQLGRTMTYTRTTDTLINGVELLNKAHHCLMRTTEFAPIGGRKYTVLSANAASVGAEIGVSNNLLYEIDKMVKANPTLTGNRVGNQSLAEYVMGVVGQANLIMNQTIMGTNQGAGDRQGVFRLGAAANQPNSNLSLADQIKQQYLQSVGGTTPQPLTPQAQPPLPPVGTPQMPQAGYQQPIPTQPGLASPQIIQQTGIASPQPVDMYQQPQLLTQPMYQQPMQQVPQVQMQQMYQQPQALTQPMYQQPMQMGYMQPQVMTHQYYQQPTSPNAPQSVGVYTENDYMAQMLMKKYNVAS